MTFRPREERRLNRRQFLGRSAGATLGLSGLGALLSGCGNLTGAPPPGAGGAAAPPPPPAPPSSDGTAPPPPSGEGTPPPAPPAETGSGAATTAGAELPFPLARPDNPVTLPIFDDNPPIESGLSPEGGPLRVYNWFEYIWKKKVKEFEKELGVKVEISTFENMDEAIAKLATGSVDYDVFFPTPDRLARLVYGKVMQPLNHDYLPNLANMWPSYENPYYDGEARYTVPYTVYTTGIGYLRNKVATDPFELDNPYEILWDTANKGKTFLLDDGREAPAFMLLKNGITDVNTEDPALLELAKEELKSLLSAVNVKTSNSAFTNVAEGKAWVHHTWSGDMLASQWYLAGGVKRGDLGFWYPPDGTGVINNDLIGVLRGAKNPVLAHLFLDFLLDDQVALDNFLGWNGYQPPLNSIDPDSLIADDWFPEGLAAAVVRESDFQNASLLLELTPQGQALWQSAWAEFKAGA
jgi:spermidine/putrescine transport system substrate-binding protein